MQSRGVLCAVSGGARPLRPAVPDGFRSAPRVQPPQSCPRVAGTRRDPAVPENSRVRTLIPSALRGRRRPGRGPCPARGSGAGWEGNAAPAGASGAPSPGTCDTSVRGYRILPCTLTGVWRYPRWHPPSPRVRRRKDPCESAAGPRSYLCIRGGRRRPAPARRCAARPARARWVPASSAEPRRAARQVHRTRARLRPPSAGPARGERHGPGSAARSPPAAPPRHLRGGEEREGWQSLGHGVAPCPDSPAGRPGPSPARGDATVPDRGCPCSAARRLPLAARPLPVLLS